MRGGTDPVARHAGRGLVAAGAEALEDLGAAVFAIDGDVGWSDERGTVWRVEGALAFPAPFHLLGEGDDARETVRLGLCLRWPGMAVARMPDDDPWTADIAVDYVSTHDDRSDTTTTGALVEVTLAWRFANHWYAAAQGSAATHARRDDGEVRAGASASGGLGATW